MSFSYDHAGVHKHAIHMGSSGETFGISQLPTRIMNELNILPAAVETPEANDKMKPLDQPTSLDLATLITITGSTLQETGAQYRFISQRQNAAHAILPIHIQAEHSKFIELLTKHFPDYRTTKHVNFTTLAKLWSSHVDGKTIFYKTPEFIRAKYTDWSDFENASDTNKNNQQAIDRIDAQLFASSRKRKAQDPEQPSPLKVPCYEAAPESSLSSAVPSSSGQNQASKQLRSIQPNTLPYLHAFLQQLRPISTPPNAMEPPLHMENNPNVAATISAVTISDTFIFSFKI
ncbi:hypothetical protein BJV82DRAFT_675605 [Fennellomyces sp. T-0311]|nr:hypothetical protein BJV82DRAFT_675605 [Fennellomyces sp. T-0311]